MRSTSAGHLLSSTVRNLGVACRAALWSAGLGATTLAGQDTLTINVYRFVLGVDVPESPSLVALGMAPAHVLRASAPKPLALSVFQTFPSGARATPGLALDVAPYFLVGGGSRTLSSYRSMTLGGRLARVLTKTIVSVGAARDPADPAGAFVGLGVRSTLHDPHDVVSLSLPEEVAAELAKAGVPMPGSTEEDLGDLGPSLKAPFAHAKRAIRTPTANPQVSTGWGVAAHLRGGVFDGDSIETTRHCLWIGAQFTPGRRFDLLTTVEVRNAFRSDDYWWLGAALERKTAATGFIAELYYDTGARRFHPGVAVDVRTSPHVGVTGSLATQSASLAARTLRRLELRLLAHWFYASDR